MILHVENKENEDFKMKKAMSVFLSLAMLVTMAVSVGAALSDETTENEQIEVTPRYSFIS